jgi:hypothetical protein
MSFQGNQLRINGHAVNGLALQNRMRTEMGRGKLRTYQLVASREWIERFRETIVRPGPSYNRSRQLIGNQYRERSRGETVRLRRSKITVELSARSPIAVVDGSPPRTVGDALTTDVGLAKAVMFGVNRPNWVTTALWLALAPANPRTVATDQMQILVREIRSGIRRGTLTKKAVYNDEDFPLLGATGIVAYLNLHAVVWPEFAAVNQAKLIGEFEANALHLHRAAEAKKFRRERRFATVTAVFKWWE